MDTKELNEERSTEKTNEPTVIPNDTMGLTPLLQRVACQHRLGHGLQEHL